MSLPQRPGADVSPTLDTVAQVAWRVIVVAIVALPVVYLLWTLNQIMIPFFIGVLIATQLQPLAERLRRTGAPAPIAVGGALLIGLGAIFGAFAAVVGVLVAEITAIGDAVGRATEDIAGWIEGGPTTVFGQTFDPQIIADQVDNISGEISGAASTIFDSVVTGVQTIFALIIGLLFALTFAIYMTLDSRSMHRWTVQRLSAGSPVEFDRVVRRVWFTLGWYVRGVAITAAVDAVLIGIGLLILGVPFAFPLAVLIFVLSFIPILGALVSGAVAVAVALADGGVGVALIVLAIVVAVQQFESLVVSPLVFRYSISLHPVVTLLSVSTGVILAGVAGAFLAVPIVAAIWSAVEEFRRIREREAPAPELLVTGPLGLGPGVDPPASRAATP